MSFLVKLRSAIQLGRGHGNIEPLMKEEGGRFSQWGQARRSRPSPKAGDKFTMLIIPIFNHTRPRLSIGRREIFVGVTARSGVNSLPL